LLKLHKILILVFGATVVVFGSVWGYWSLYQVHDIFVPNILPEFINDHVTHKHIKYCGNQGRKIRKMSEEDTKKCIGILESSNCPMGNCDLAIILDAIQELTPSVRDCYQSVLHTKPNQNSELAISFSIDKNRRLKDIAIDFSQMEVGAMKVCLESRFRSMRVSTPTHGREVRLHMLTFRLLHL